MNKVEWRREESGDLIPYMYEQVGDRYLWLRYNRSKISLPDNKFTSKGFPSFCNAIKQGYEPVKSVERS